MPQNTNLNASPYFEDFDPQKNFYKVLFRPGYAVQARELTSLQSILQTQLENFGRNIFKQGDLVVPGEVGLNTRLNYVKLSSVSEVAISDSDGNITYQKYDIKTLVGLKVQGVSSNVLAIVVAAEYGSDTESDTIYVNYLDSGSSADEERFRQGETLEVVGGINSPLLVVGTDGVSLPTSIIVTDPDFNTQENVESPALGYASAVKVEEGIYFVNGYFVRNSEQLLIVDKYYDKPSAKVGFKIEESLVTPEQDNSLYDNARGFSNFSAPGAHRLKIDLTLVRYDYYELTDRNFIQLLLVKEGVIQKQLKATDYSLVESVIARKTFDESGDYVVEPFSIQVREYYQNNDNLGFYSKDDNGLVNGLTEDAAKAKLLGSIGSGKAYIRGYEVKNNETKYIEIDKARDTLKQENKTLKTSGLSTFYITNVYGTTPLNAEGAELSPYPSLYLNSVFNDGTISLNNTEESTDRKQTISRRGLGFDVQDGIKTIYLQLEDTDYNYDSFTDATFQSLIPRLWFIKTRSDAGSVNDYSFVETLAFSRVKRPEIDGVGLSDYLEITVKGNRAELDIFLTEFDDTNSSSSLRELFISETDVQNNTNPLFSVRDYNETITPIIGLAKPKNIALKEISNGFNKETDKVVSKGRLAGGSESYNSIFGLSYFAPEFFTRLLLEETIIGDSFSPGKYIFGSNSNAVAVIEGGTNATYSSITKLFVTMVYGEFTPGETIIAEDGSTIKIATDNTISHFVVTKRGDSYTLSTKMILDGVTFDRNKVDMVISGGGSIIKAYVKDRSAVSTIYAQPPVVELSGTAPINPAVITPVLFRNSVYTYSPRNVKSLYSKFGSGDKNKFSADIELEKTGYVNTLSVTDFTFSGTEGYKFIECNGFGGDASKILTQGDVVQFSDNSGVVSKYIVQYATQPDGVKRSRIYLDTALQNDVVTSSVVVQKPLVDNPNGTLVFPTGDKQIKSLIDSSEDSKIQYYFRRDFITTASSGSGNLTFAAQLPFGTQRFAEFSQENFLVTIIDPGVANHALDTSGNLVLFGGPIKTGDVIYVDPSYVNINQSDSNLTAGSVTINFPENHFGDIDAIRTALENRASNPQPNDPDFNLPTINFPTLKLTATLQVSKAKPRLKTSIKNKRIIVQSSGTTLVPFRGQEYEGDSIQIVSYSDVFRLRYVYEGSISSPPSIDAGGNLISGTDVTNRYVFDNGQRDTHYDVARLVLKPGLNAPTGQLVIAFDYFEHSQGDFCTIDSYLHEAGVPEEEIPNFNSSVNGLISLKDVIDFRPKVDNSNILPGYQDNSFLAQEEYLSFSGTSGIASSTPSSDLNLPWTLKYNQDQYLDRIDAVFLNNKGNFIVKKGNASLNPSRPESISDAIPLYYLYIPAYTDSFRDVRVIPVENKRYTMKDIGKIDRRVERLEYYTSLSILEQQALNMQIRDDIGLDRFKSGFYVDNFETHKGDIKSIDHKCAIDTQQSVLRPQVNEDSLLLKEVNTRRDQREISGYVNNNGVITLPYTDVRLLGNNFATKTINPNPFVVLQYVGDLAIDPIVDSWYDRSIAPLITDNNTNLFVPFIAKEDVVDAFASTYNSFIVTWSGAERSFYNINSLSTTNSEISLSEVISASVSSSSNISPLNNETPKGVSTKSSRGKSVVSSLQYFARSIPVKFVIRRLKPKTEVFVFLEGKKINRWAAPDIRFTGIPGNSISTFNSPIISDDNGNVSGIILIPAGKAPRQGAVWTGDANTVSYDESSEEVRVTVGEKTLRFTSSATNASKDEVRTFAETKFYATGLLPENPSSIISTKPSYFKANEGIQLVQNNTEQEQKPSPLAQTFKIENFEGGVFTTGVDLFFAKKSDTIPLRVYLSDVDSEKPGKNIVPGTEVSMEPYTYIKAYVSDSVTLIQGETIVGDSTNASGPLLKVLDKNGNQVSISEDGEITITNEQVYTLILENHNGISFIPDERLKVPSITSLNNFNNTDIVMRIAKDSGIVSSLRVTNTGDNYDSATITIESPSLPGGSNATGTVLVSNGIIYTANLTLPGRGYTEPPSVVIRGTGIGNGNAVVETEIEITEPAVRMGIAIDSVGSVPSLVATRFNFDYPIYLQNNTEYTLVVETDSQDYEIWASRLGETEIATSTTVTTNPALGSVFKSQNTNSWVEDLFEDIKFTLYRAEFDISKVSRVDLTNKPLGFESMQLNPIETYAFANANATSELFKNNNNIIKVYHKNHGFEDDNSYVFFKNLESVAGFSQGTLNSTLFKASNTGVDTFNISGIGRAADTVFGGGDSALISANKKYERLLAQISYIQSPFTNIDTSVKTTNIVPVDSNTINYTSYSVTDFERTFLNEEQYFINQKIVASDLNSLLNSLPNSLVYRLEFSSEKSYLSPVIDIKNSSIKISTNRVENGTGDEKRFGKRYQLIEFYPVYRLTVEGNRDGDDNLIGISVGQTLEGIGNDSLGIEASGCRAEVVRYSSSSNSIFIKVKNSTLLFANEKLFFSQQSQSGSDLDGIDVTVSGAGLIREYPDLDFDELVTAINPSNTTQKYNNLINGTVVLWDIPTQTLKLENDKQPINSDYTSASGSGSFIRQQQVADQSSDIFRVGDLVSFSALNAGNERFFEIKSMTFTNGIDFVPEDSTIGSSSVAKYVTKEISLQNQASAIDVIITANVTDTTNIKVLYKTKTTSVQKKFEEIEWILFNGSGYPDEMKLASPQNVISPQKEEQSAYQEFRYSVDNLDNFTSYGIKISMQTDNPSYVPKIQDIRVVASQ
ncbi:Virulence Associated protein [Synechococcus phage S-PM2]|uniref:Virulence Associated protein n=1 Tax=Synechococcus phage S-PM2 TaxID=238854 RepID=Q5GQW9_BPSYP|nr:Virulence Associated protein [Synechococcus phage S-PM2]CAF34148.1 Virulence Associated protein [Synechococcus phage S-PM2]CFW42218.1 Virulence Associated protein [Synechococcus phage S-PM2]